LEKALLERYYKQQYNEVNVARQPPELKIAGSNPAGRTIFSIPQPISIKDMQLSWGRFHISYIAELSGLKTCLSEHIR
jgi:hypothetical protein